MDLSVYERSIFLGGRRFAVTAMLLLALGMNTTVSAQTAAGATGKAVAEKPSLNPLDALSRLGQSLRGNDAGDEFLDPEVAFVLAASPVDSQRFVARWTIADGYYLYKNKFKFTIKGASTGATLGAAEMPAGKVKDDEFFGRMEVFYKQAEAVVPVQYAGEAPLPLTVEIGYQGCADAGLCYPPIKKTVDLFLPTAAAAAVTNSLPLAPGPDVAQDPGSGSLSEQDRIARTLFSGSLLVTVLSFFGFGLLLTFTPCVFPMIPILSGIIMGQGDKLTTGRAFILSSIYVLAMAATYTAVGVAAGLSGQNLQIVFQNPWVLTGFSVLFVALAFSMFGFYELQLPSSWQSRLSAISQRQQGGTYAGVAIMGVLSALIVGPCVAAPLAGALIYIAQTGDGVLGGTALFAMSMGMGAPLIVVGTSGGKLLPKAGPWMDAVKAVFGVMLLAVAIYLLERIIPGWIALLLWAALFIVSGIYMGALEHLAQGASGWRRLWKGAGLVLLIYGVLVMVGAAGGGDDVLRPLKGVSMAGGAAEKALAFQNIKGSAGLDSALKVAVTQGKPVMLDFYADWCVSCKELEKYTFSDPGVQAQLSDAVLLRTDVTANDAQDQALLRRFQLFGPPALLFFGPDGRERPRFRVVGFVDAEEFRGHLSLALS